MLATHKASQLVLQQSHTGEQKQYITDHHGGEVTSYKTWHTHLTRT